MNFLATIFFALLGSQAVLGALLPKCKDGTGLTDATAKPWGLVQPGDCTLCRVDGCSGCNYDFKKCYSCAPVHGPSKTEPCDNDDYEDCEIITECSPCPKGCAGCSIDAAKCEAPMVDCPAKPLKPATKAKSVEFKRKERYCSQNPGMTGTGYAAIFTGLVKDGVCLNCADTTPYGSGIQGFGLYIPPFCDMLTTARNVAANAFPECPNTILVLKQTCHTSRASRPGSDWPLRFFFRGHCKANGVTKYIQVEGQWSTSYPADWDFSGEFEGTLVKKKLPASKWTWAAINVPSARAPAGAVG